MRDERCPPLKLILLSFFSSLQCMFYDANTKRPCGFDKTTSFNSFVISAALTHTTPDPTLRPIPPPTPKLILPPRPPLTTKTDTSSYSKAHSVSYPSTYPKAYPIFHTISPILLNQQQNPLHLLPPSPQQNLQQPTPALTPEAHTKSHLQVYPQTYLQSVEERRIEEVEENLYPPSRTCGAKQQQKVNVTSFTTPINLSHLSLTPSLLKFFKIKERKI